VSGLGWRDFTRPLTGNLLLRRNIAGRRMRSKLTRKTTKKGIDGCEA
jgi:hypothetical protein